MSLGKEAECSVIGSAGKDLVQLSATVHLGTAVVLAEHVHEVGLREHTCLPGLQRDVRGHCSRCHDGKERITVWPYVHTVLNGTLKAHLQTHRQKLAGTVVGEHDVEETSRVGHVYTALRRQRVLTALHLYADLRKGTACTKQQTN